MQAPNCPCQILSNEQLLGRARFSLCQSSVSQSAHDFCGHSFLPGVLGGCGFGFRQLSGSTQRQFYLGNCLPLALFKQIEDAQVQIHDPELRKILNPTTADLRFADYLVKHVTENRDDVFLDGTGWEGGDEWIRAQFSAYLHALLAAVLQPGRTDPSTGA